jgi:serine/threonine protein kinase
MPICLSAIGTFQVGSYVQPQSWGRRSTGSSGSSSSGLRTSNSSHWSHRDFQVLGELGRGHFGNVYKGIVHRTKKVALKKFNKEEILLDADKGGRGLELLEREVSIHSSVKHEYIIPFYGYYEDPRDLTIVLKYAPIGDLLDYMAVEFRGGKCAARKKETVRLVLSQLTSALTYLADLQIAHRDIKPENILVASHTHVQIADFGWACWYKHCQWQMTLCGTPEYVPPECLQGKGYRAHAVDSWALGVLAWELEHGLSPFYVKGSQCDRMTRDRIFQGIRQFRGIPSSIPSSKSPLVDDFCRSLLQVRPEDRMEPCEALGHALFLEQRVPISTTSPTVAQRVEMFRQTSHVRAA